MLDGARGSRGSFDSVEANMPITTMVSVTVSPQARSFIDRHGQAEEFGKMMDRARQVVPGLRSIEVVLDEPTEEMLPGVVLWVHRDDIGQGSDTTHRDWIDWMAVTFPPNVCQNFALLSVYRDHGR